MAGSKETPGDRRARDEALLAAAEAAEREARAAERPTTERRAAPASGRATIASAAAVPLNDRRAIAKLRAQRQAWQTDAWDYVRELPEVGATLRFAANMMSKIRVYAAVRPDPEGEPVPVDDEASGLTANEAELAKVTLERLGAGTEGGWSSLLKALDWNLCEVTGEAYLHGHEDPETKRETWAIRSVDELVAAGDHFELRTALGAKGEKVPSGDVVKRLWDPDPRFSSLATSPMREVLSTCEVLLLLSRAMRADAMSHLNSGILVKAHEMSFGGRTPAEADADEPQDAFEESLNQLLLDSVEDPGSSSQVAPGVISAPAEFAEKDKYLWHLTFKRDIDDKLVQWIESLVMRLARGLNMPVEVTRGLADTTYANASVAKKSEWDSYGEPRAVLMVDALTVGYYREALVEGNMDPDKAARVFVWYEPAGALAAPDPADYADKDHEDGIISDDARRKAHGWNEADAPDDLDLLRRMMYQGKIRDPGLIVQILRLLGVADLEMPAPAPAQAVAASANPQGLALGRRLAAIDRDLRLRVHVAAEQAMRRLLDRAGAKVRPKLGRDGPAATAAASITNRRLCASLGRDVVTAAAGDLGDVVDGAFDELADDLGAWVEIAQRAAVAEVERHLGPLAPGAAEELRAAQARGLDAARERLREAMTDLAGRRLYDPAPGAVAVGEADASATVPAGLVREVLALAGGDKPQGGDGGPLTSPDGGPVGGVATGPDLMAATGGVEGYVWDYGSAPRAPFEPHLVLDGVAFESFDSDVLANTEGWPDLAWYAPGDHDGCVCDAIPVILTPDESGD